MLVPCITGRKSMGQIATGKGRPVASPGSRPVDFFQIGRAAAAAAFNDPVGYGVDYRIQILPLKLPNRQKPGFVSDAIYNLLVAARFFPAVPVGIPAIFPHQRSVI